MNWPIDFPEKVYYFRAGRRNLSQNTHCVVTTLDETGRPAEIMVRNTF